VIDKRSPQALRLRLGIRMNPCKVGDWIIWRDESIETEDGAAFVSPGMKGKVISLHDGFHMDLIQGGSVPPKAVVQFENGMTLMMDERMRWERVT